MARKRTYYPKPLRPIERRFIDAYVANLNGTRAAILAGYSPKSAANAAYRLLVGRWV